MRVFPFIALAVLLSTTVAAQDIPIKTHRIVDGSQFDVYPSERGIQSFMLKDELFDAFRNPALGSFSTNHSITLLPTVYRQERKDILGGQRSGRTFPIAGNYAGERWFGSAMVAGQQLFFPTFRYSGGERHDESIVRENAYAALNVGTELGAKGATMGIGVSGRALTAKEGRDQITPLGQGFDMTGYQYRLSLGGQYPFANQHHVDAVVSYARHRLTRNVVSIADSPVIAYGSEADEAPILPPYNADHSDDIDIFGVEATYRYDVNERWTIGGNVRAQHHVHADVVGSRNQPHFEGGRSMMFRLGVGAARTTDRLELTGDLAFEPGISRMTQNIHYAIGPYPRDLTYGYRNAFLRLGSRVFLGGLTIHAGTQLRYYDVQDDYQSEKHYRRWNEVAASVGLTYDFSFISLSYLASVDSGPHIHASSNRFASAYDSPFLAGLVLHPIDRADRNDHSHTHRIQITVPIGR